MHPVKKKERWWVGFKLPGAERTEELPDIVIFDGSSPYPRAWPNHGLQASGTRGIDSGVIPKLKSGWRVKVGETDYRNGPALVDGRVYVTTGQDPECDAPPEGLWCYDALSGEVLWHFSTSEGGVSNDLLEERGVFLASVCYGEVAYCSFSDRGLPWFTPPC